MKLSLPLLILSLCSAGTVVAASPPRVFMLNPEHLEIVRAGVGDPHSVFADDLRELFAKADALVEAGRVYSVTDTEDLPPSGDIHDYFSTSPYWWPDPSQPEGLPYIRRDGETNPERDRISDRKPLEAMVAEVGILSRAYTFSGHEPYARQASRLIHTWFLDPETRMNPNLNHGQLVRGRNLGKAGALIGTRRFCLLLDSVGLLRGAEAWTCADEAGLKAWMSAFFDWMMVHPFGAEERAAANNHGTAFDMQAVSIALFLDKPYAAELLLRHHTIERIRTQIAPDGAQPEELARTKSWNYCVENIKYFFRLARMARHVGIDLYSVHPEGSGSLKTAIEFLLPYTTPEKSWPFEQITAWQPERFALTLQVARAVYDEAELHQAAQRMGWDQPRLEAFINMPGHPSTPIANP